MRETPALKWRRTTTPWHGRLSTFPLLTSNTGTLSNTSLGTTALSASSDANDPASTREGRLRRSPGVGCRRGCVSSGGGGGNGSAAAGDGRSSQLRLSQKLRPNAAVGRSRRGRGPLPSTRPSPSLATMGPRVLPPHTTLWVLRALASSLKQHYESYGPLRTSPSHNIMSPTGPCVLPPHTTLWLL